jgi:hypothetical protein
MEYSPPLRIDRSPRFVIANITGNDSGLRMPMRAALIEVAIEQFPNPLGKAAVVLPLSTRQRHSIYPKGDSQNQDADIHSCLETRWRGVNQRAATWHRR